MPDDELERLRDETARKRATMRRSEARMRRELEEDLAKIGRKNRRG